MQLVSMPESGCSDLILGEGIWWLALLIAEWVPAVDGSG